MQFNNVRSILLLCLLIIIFPYYLFAQDEDVIIVESEMVDITVSDEFKPTIEWSGDIKIGRLLVMQESREFWGSETEGENIYHLYNMELILLEQWSQNRHGL